MPQDHHDICLTQIVKAYEAIPQQKNLIEKYELD